MRAARLLLIRWGLPALFVPALLLGNTGCAFLAVPFEATKSHGVPAKFTLPDRPTVVVVDANPQIEFADAFARQVVARANEQLTANTVLLTADIVDAAKVQAIRDDLGDTFDSLAIDEIGRRVGAETVVYARVDKVRLNVEGSLYKPEAGLKVKVVDALTGKRLFPDAEASGLAGRSPSYPLAVDGVYEDRDTLAASRTTDSNVSRALADDAGLALARLFYEWQKPKLAEKAFEERERRK